MRDSGREKGTGLICAKHPPGFSGESAPSPFPGITYSHLAFPELAVKRQGGRPAEGNRHPGRLGHQLGLVDDAAPGVSALDAIVACVGQATAANVGQGERDPVGKPLSPAALAPLAKHCHDPTYMVLAPASASTGRFPPRDTAPWWPASPSPGRPTSATSWPPAPRSPARPDEILAALAGRQKANSPVSTGKLAARGPAW